MEWTTATITYLIWYSFCHGYTLHSGMKEITLWADESDPCKIMWKRMEESGRFTLPVTAKQARIINIDEEQ